MFVSVSYYFRRAKPSKARYQCPRSTFERFAYERFTFERFAYERFAFERFTFERFAFERFAFERFAFVRLAQLKLSNPIRTPIEAEIQSSGNISPIISRYSAPSLLPSIREF